MNRIAHRAGIAYLLAILLIAGFTFFLVEYFAEADTWVVFPGSPHVYRDGTVGCGVVTDRDRYLLLDLRDGRSYSEDALLRAATVHWVGDRNGNVSAPALSYHATAMSGFNLLSGVYTYGKNSAVAEYGLSAKVQRVALEALGDYKGTVAVYNYKTGQILCSVSTPAYDPDNVPEEMDGMYLNRFTQGVYVPGSIFKIVTLAAALDSIEDVEEQTFFCSGKYEIGADAITCETAHGSQDLKAAFRNSCNCAFAEIALQIGGEGLEQYVQQFCITECISFDGITTVAGSFEAADAAPINVAWSGIGQYNDQINPCVFLNFVGAVAGEGKGAKPYLVEKISVGSKTTYRAETETGARLMSATTANTVKEYMCYNVDDYYGPENFCGLTVGAKTGTGEVGGGKKPNAMFAGFVDDEQYPLAFIVAVEDAGYGGKVCIPIVSKVLEACKEALN